jgi:hypothetical protein
MRLTAALKGVIMKKTKTRFFCMTVAVALLCAVLLACGGSPPAQSVPASAAPTASASAPDDLNAVVRETSDYLNKQLPKGNKLLILNIQSEFPALSEYIIDELIANTVNDRIFSVVDRQQLDAIRAELGFQMSGEVDDATAQALGRIAGAQIIISGAVSRIGDLYRLRVRALSVQSAQIEGQFNRNIPNNPTIAALAQSKATGYGSGTAVASAGAASARGTATAAHTPVTMAATTAPVTAQTPAPQTQRQISENDLVGVWKGSYVAGQGETAMILSVYEERGAYVAIWDFYNLPGKSNAREGKFYMQVSYNRSREKFYLKATEWIERPSGYNFADLEGTITGDVFSGFLSNSNNKFRVVRQETN